VKETRQRFFAAPPVQVVPAGSVMARSAGATVVGARMPFLVTVAATKELPVPVGSTRAVTWVDPSWPALKFTAVAANEFVASRGTAVDESMV